MNLRLNNIFINICVFFAHFTIFFKYEYDLLSLVLSLDTFSRPFLNLTFSSSNLLAVRDNNFILEPSSLLICFC